MSYNSDQYPEKHLIWLFISLCRLDPLIQFLGFLPFYIQKVMAILSWIEFIPLADRQINKGEDKGAENSTTVNLNCCICLFQLRAEELLPHKGILKRLNESGGIALGSASLDPDRKHKLESALKEANHRLVKVRHISDVTVIWNFNWQQIFALHIFSYVLFFSGWSCRNICTHNEPVEEKCVQYTAVRNSNNTRSWVPEAMLHPN